MSDRITESVQEQCNVVTCSHHFKEVGAAWGSLLLHATWLGHPSHVAGGMGGHKNLLVFICIKVFDDHRPFKQGRKTTHINGQFDVSFCL